MSDRLFDKIALSEIKKNRAQWQREWEGTRDQSAEGLLRFHYCI
jgi:hypothetical protein